LAYDASLLLDGDLRNNEIAAAARALDTTLVIPAKLALDAA
jgi:hypothetical protein